MSLTQEQQAFLELVLERRPRLAILTGGPGTGKSFATAALVEAARAQRLTVELAAPTGKGALRVQELAGTHASTIHSLLGIRPGGWEPFELAAQIVVVDEASMIETQLMAALMTACRCVQTLVLIGDPDQLPPVGPGSPFLDMIQGGRVPTVRLTEVHRQAKDSGIVQAAHAIRAGRPPVFNETDFQLVRVDDADQLSARVYDLTSELGLDPRESQVLIPQGPRVAGHQEFNALVEERRGGPALVRDRFRPGTKVVNTKNDGRLGILNGAIGFVDEAYAGASQKHDHLVVSFDSGEVCYMTGGALKQLLPAWAITMHRAQGSEWLDVVVVAHRTHSRMLTRALLYVAVTRARRRVFVVGTPGAVMRAVGKTQDLRRRTLLSLWAKGAA